MAPKAKIIRTQLLGLYRHIKLKLASLVERKLFTRSFYVATKSLQ